MANTMEKDVEATTGSVLKSHGCRARPVMVAWKMITPGKARVLQEEEAIFDGWK